jgi:hypothetical protein
VKLLEANQREEVAATTEVQNPHVKLMSRRVRRQQMIKLNNLPRETRYEKRARVTSTLKLEPEVETITRGGRYGGSQKKS